jgi:hypothetical protein
MKAQTQWLFETPPTTQQGKFDFEGNSNSINWETSSDWLFESPLPSTPAYTQCDFIDPRIDVDAQYALFEMLKGDIPTRTAAISMLSAVKNGSLGGIYKEDQQVPAKRAQRIGKTWWTLIPSGQSAICVTQPPSEPQIIVFKKSLTNRTLLGTALLTAWSTCRVPIPTPFPPSGRICPNRPQPQPTVKVPTVKVPCDPRFQCCGPGCTPPDEIPPKRACNQDKLNQELSKCQKELEQCYERHSINMSAILAALAAIPSVGKCFGGILKRNPKALIDCAKTVPAAKGLLDEYFKRAKARQNCEFALQMCRLNAEVSSGCFKE